MEVKDGSAQTNLRRRTEQWKVTLQQAWVQEERSIQEEQASGEAGGEATGASPAEAGQSIEHEDVLRQALHGHELGTYSPPPADEEAWCELPTGEETRRSEAQVNQHGKEVERQSQTV